MAEETPKDQEEMKDEEKTADDQAPAPEPEGGPAEEQPEAAPEASADDAEQAEGAPDEAPAEEEAPADDAPADEGPDEMEGLDWKARSRLERSRQPGEARPQQSPEERTKTRAERRALAAKRRSSYRRKRREKHEAGEGTPPAESRSAGRKVRQGRVVSNKAAKTITVRIDVARRHPTYEKIVRQSNTLHAHDERDEANEGDLVRVVETRPLSKTKRWRLVEILEKAE
jgi:small subunit ribosomal protein S17